MDDDFFLPTVSNKTNNETENIKEASCIDLEAAVNKILKKGKVFEIRRKTRRINSLRRKKGSESELDKNQRKISRILNDIEAFKYLSNEILVDRIVEVLRHADEPSSLDMAITESLESCKDLERTDTCLSNINSMAENAYLKLINSGNIRKLLVELGKKYQLDKFHDKSRVDMTVESSKENCLPSASSETINKTVKNENLKPTDTEDKKIEKSNINQSIENRKIVTHAKKSRSRKNEIFEPRKKAKRLVECDKNSKGVQNDRKPREKFSNFNSFFGKGDMKIKKGNRLGQRARRELWTEMYGSEANHVRHNLPFRGRTKQQNRHKVTINNEKKKKDNKRTSKVPKSNIEDKIMENLHPSWQAKKLQKQQSGIVEFQGNKVVFDD